MSKAILVVSFGTSYVETRQKTIGACEDAIQKAFPDYEVRRAFTSNFVINKIKREENVQIDTVAQALEKLKQEGFKEVYVQPLHIIVGGEYEKIVHQAQAYQDSFDTLKVGRSLLYDMTDYENIKALLLEKYGYFGQGTATILMGHGSQHYAFTAYAALDHMLMGENVRVAAVESYPSVEDIETSLTALEVNHIHLAPFMLVAGDHATNDMASDEEDSWYTYFKNRGYEVSAHLVGLGEFPEVQQMYVERVQALMQ